MPINTYMTLPNAITNATKFAKTEKQLIKKPNPNS